MYRASLAADSGDWDRLSVFAARSMSLGSSFADANLAHSQGAFRLLRAFHKGRCEDELDSVRALQQRFSEFYPWRAVLAFFLLNAGRSDEAEVEYHRLIGDPGRANRDSIWLLAHCFIAETAIGLGDHANLRTFYEDLRPFSHLQAVAGYGVATWGSVARVLGRLATTLGDDSEALLLFDTAVEREHSSGAVLWEAYSLLERSLARTRVGSGLSTDASHRDLERSREIAGRLRAACLTEQVVKAANYIAL